MQLDIQIDDVLLNNVKRALGDMEKRAPNALAGAINETTAEQKTDIAKAIYDRINLTSARIKKQIDIKKATPQNLSGYVRLSHEERIPLKYFGARQTKAGVSYKIGRKEARRVIGGFFILPSLDDHVFAKEGARKPREKKLKRSMKVRVKGKRTQWMWPDLRIKKKFGASPWGVFVKAGLVQSQFEIAQADFEKNVQQRINSILGGFVKYGDTGKAKYQGRAA